MFGCAHVIIVNGSAFFAEVRALFVRDDASSINCTSCKYMNNVKTPSSNTGMEFVLTHEYLRDDRKWTAAAMTASSSQVRIEDVLAWHLNQQYAVETLSRDACCRQPKRLVSIATRALPRYLVVSADAARCLGAMLGEDAATCALCPVAGRMQAWPFHRRCTNSTCQRTRTSTSLSVMTSLAGVVAFMRTYPVEINQPSLPSLVTTLGAKRVTFTPGRQILNTKTDVARLWH